MHPWTGQPIMSVKCQCASIKPFSATHEGQRPESACECCLCSAIHALASRKTGRLPRDSVFEYTEGVANRRLNEEEWAKLKPLEIEE